jgi:hypothetical protein
MRTWEVEIGALITIQEGDSFVVAAETKEEAIRIAKGKLEEKIANNYEWADYDSGDLTCDYVAEC